jgi:hypothetical protein
VHRHLFRAGASGLLIAVVLVIATASSAQAGVYGTQEYETNEQCDPVEVGHHDPVTAVFNGEAANPGYLADDINFMTGGWTDWPEAHHGYMWDNGYCIHEDKSVASAVGFGNTRYHIRLWHALPSGGTNWTVGTPHHEVWDSRCLTHQVDWGAVDRGNQYKNSHGSGFDLGRRRIYGAFHDEGQRHHGSWYVTEGNTRSFKQGCTNTWVGSNGKTVWVAVGRR